MLKKIWSYLTFQKQPDYGKEGASYIRIMHGINRISLFMALIGMVFVLIRMFK